MSEHIVKKDTFIPVDLSAFPDIPDQPMLNPEIIHEVDIEHNYPFLDKTFKSRFINFCIYTAIYVLVFPVHVVRYGLKIKGRKNLRKNRKYLKKGAITVSNHVYRWDYLAVLQAVKYRRMYFPARAAQVMGSDASLIRGAGGIPVPSSIAGLRGFYGAFDELARKKIWFHVFPESCRWDYYEPVRPFKNGAFKMAIRYERPVIPMVFSYRKPTGIYKLLKVKHPLITLTIGEPIIPAFAKGKTKNEIAAEIRKNAHDQMVTMAGIEKNMWPDSDPSERE